MISAGILTISDKGARGQRIDQSGQEIKEILSTLNSHIARYEIVPDEREIIAAWLTEGADKFKLDIILTTGGTGLSERDVTPEATLAVVDKMVPGITEAMRMRTFDRAPTAILSRAVAGVRGKCLIINLPGSPRGVRECLEVILPVIPHAIEIIKGIVTEHKPEKEER